MEQVTKIDMWKVATVCHEVNRAYCKAIGDDSQPAWEDAPRWQQESAVNGVRFVLYNPNAEPADQHQNWVEGKAADGWTYGPVKDVDKKTHPCMLPYESLPQEQKIKDHLFRAVVLSMV